MARVFWARENFFRFKAKKFPGAVCTRKLFFVRNRHSASFGVIENWKSPTATSIGLPSRTVTCVTVRS